jgi:Arc/MetJ-type ribon-helix-helix transcriptional regulator
VNYVLSVAAIADIAEIIDWGTADPPNPNRPDRGMTACNDGGMTRKIGICLNDALYEWAAAEVAEGRAESVSALIAEGLEILAARSRLEALVADLRAEAGEPDEQTKEQLRQARDAADEAYRRHLARGAPDAA